MDGVGSSSHVTLCKTVLFPSEVSNIIIVDLRHLFLTLDVFTLLHSNCIGGVFGCLFMK